MRTKHKVSVSAYSARIRGVTYEGSRFLNVLSGSFQYYYGCITDGKDVLFAERDTDFKTCLISIW